MDGANVTGAENQDGLFASAVLDGSRIYVKVVNTSDQTRDITLCFNGLRKKETVRAVEGVRLSSDQLYADNTLDDPNRFQSVSFAFSGEGKTIEASLPAYSFNIFVLEKD